MHSILYMGLTVVGVAVITVVALVLSVRKHGPEIAAAQTAFFTETGYRYPEIATGSIEQQVRHVPRVGSVARMSLEKHYVKPDAETPIAFDSTTQTEGRYRVSRESWCMTLARPPAIRLQIAERKLLPTVGKAVKEHLTGQQRSWTQLYPGPIDIGDAALDQRFAVFGEDADAVRRVIAQPAVRDKLLECAEVALVVDDRAIALSDPNGENLAAGRTARRGLNAAPTIRASIPVHRRVHALLGAIRDAVAQR